MWKEHTSGSVRTFSAFEFHSRKVTPFSLALGLEPVLPPAAADERCHLLRIRSTTSAIR